MGQSYDVEFDLKVKDRDGLIQAINEYIDSTKEYVIWHLDGLDRTNLTDLMKALITDRGFFAEGDYFSSGFDASYGWETVMMDGFEYMAPYLMDGSTLDIWPDYGKDSGRVKNGKVEWIS